MSPLTRRQHIILRLVVVPMACPAGSSCCVSAGVPRPEGLPFPVGLFSDRCHRDALLLGSQSGCIPVAGQLFTVRSAAHTTADCPDCAWRQRHLTHLRPCFPVAQRLYTSHWPSVPTVLKGIVVCVTLASLVNGGYAGLYLLQAFYAERGKNKTAQASAGSELLSGSNQPAGAAGLVAVDTPTGQVRLPMDQIAYFYSARGLVLLVKNDGQQMITRFSSFPGLLPYVG